MTASTTKPESRWHQKRQATQQRIDVNAEKVAAWHQMERIENYFPALEAQREKLAADLRDLDRLIEDEKQAVRETRNTIV